MKAKLMILLLLQCCLYSCITVSTNGMGKKIKGNGVSTHKEMDLKTFKKLRLRAPIALKIVEGSAYTLTLVGDENLVSLVTYTQDGDLLKIHLTENNINFDHKVTATLTMPTSLEEIRTSGMPNVHIIQKITADKFTVDCSGMTKLDIDHMFAPHFNVEVSGMSKVNATGETTTLNADCSGMSDINLLDFKAEKADVDCSGMSNVTVWATEKLSADCSGMSKIVYKGAPTTKELSKSGMSSIKQQ